MTPRAAVSPVLSQLSQTIAPTLQNADSSTETIDYLNE